MTGSRLPGPIGKKDPECSLKDGTLARHETPSPGSLGRSKESAKTNDVLRRIKKWRNAADFTGFYPNAVRALDHYLDRTGTFVVIPPNKVASVRKDATESHLEKSKAAFKKAAVLEAGATWLAANGFPASGGNLVPQQIEFILTYQTGTAGLGVTDDNLAYYGSAINSEVRFKAEQTSFPTDSNEESFTVEISVIEWKSWVVDNYDWEGDKQFGIFPMFGLPTQVEMNSLQQAGLAKSYQRSSNSWIVTDHGLASWPEFIYAVNTLKVVAGNRQKSNQTKEKEREKQRKGGALPTPRPAEEMTHCFAPQKAK